MTVRLRFLPVLLLLAACASTANRRIPAPPPTETRLVTETMHGVTITDPYRWLEEQNAPETRAWIDAQNAYTDQILTSATMRETFARRLDELLRSDQFSTPVYRDGRYFFTRRSPEQDLFAIYLRESGNDVLLIDPAPLSPDKTTSVGISDVSDDGKLLAYYVRKGGADETVVRFFDVDARRNVGAEMPLARYSGISLTPDRSTIYYSRMTPDGPRVYRRRVDGGEPEKLFGDGYTPDKIISAQLSEDGRQLLMTVSHGSAASKTELYLKDLTTDAPIRTIVNDKTARFSAQFAGDRIALLTNLDAPNQRVLVTSIADPQNWKEIVPENRTSAIQGVSVAGGRLFVRYLENVRPTVVSYDLDGRSHGNIAFEQLGSLGNVSGSWSSPVAFFSFSSFNVPPTIYEYRVAGGARTIFARQSSPVNPDDFVVEQVWYPSKDGTRVPMFVMYKKGLRRDGTAPTYLTGYGGFTVSELPAFSARAIAWAEQGGVYALPNLRGGGEFGEAWHRAGMLEQKQKTFDDFIGAAEYLIRERYTAPRHLGVAGRSNGGLLVMAMAIQRPDLARAVVCGYPLIDMLRYQRFLVGRFWVPEYGDPENAEHFRFLHAYSPYHHVNASTDCPAIYFYSGDADTRVAPLHARKMTALMQAADPDTEPIVLRYQVTGGHSGGEARNVTVKHESESMAFLWMQLGPGR
ncbi:MAG TPA: prolyl oligopeptidase family serine peptidase [Thermoanaerobaculia bacterium]